MQFRLESICCVRIRLQMAAARPHLHRHPEGMRCARKEAGVRMIIRGSLIGALIQKNYKQYATDEESFSTKGGALCIPAFGGLGGALTYPPANPSAGVGLVSSTSDYNHELPQLHRGTPIFFLQLAIKNGTTSQGQDDLVGHVGGI